jgi:hypothetical protein
MAIHKPYHRICRPFIDGRYFTDIEGKYFVDPRYASERSDLIRGYHLLEKELYQIFEYIEPADANESCYSHQIYALFLRASTEFEANASAILKANGYQLPRKRNFVNMEDYFKVDVATKLSEYSVTIPIWNGLNKTFRPLEDWAKLPTSPDNPPWKVSWYDHYNNVKHNRLSNFECASMANAIRAVGSVFCILFSQFHTSAFDPNQPISSYSIDDGIDGRKIWSHPSCRLAIEPPNSWQDHEKYDFDWTAICNDTDPFQNYTF